MKVLFIVATHGNEGFSIPVFERLEKEFPREKYEYDWIIGNPRAQEKNIRFIDVDMNRNAPGDIHASSYEEKRVAEIIQQAQAYDAVIDVHGAVSNCGVSTIVSYPTVDNFVLANQVGCSNNVIWNSKRSLEKGPINQHVGKPAIELECGPKEDPAIGDALYETVAHFLKVKNTIVFRGDTLNWYEVIGKRNKSEYLNVELEDFEMTVGTESITPFLSSNTYPEGSFYILQKIDFTTLFLQ